MKKLFIIMGLGLLTTSIFAQAPEKMSYQAVVRDVSNSLVTNQPVGMQISIIQGSILGASVYVETQNASTNTNGLVSLEIGTGAIVSGDFTTIDWANGPYFIKTETDPTGGIAYSITGTSQLLSVPYALYAKTSGSSTPGPQGTAGLDGATGPQGLPGTDGVDGNGIVSTTDNGNGTFTLLFDDASTFTTSDLTGAQGNTGPQGVPGANGVDGNGIVSTTDNGDGTFTLLFDDASTFTTADLTGAQGITGAQGVPGANGLDGNGIVSTTDNGNGTFTLLFDDASTFTTADLTGPQGIAGVDGLLPNGSATGNTTFWDGTAWVVNNNNIYNAGVNVGIGTSTPQAKLEVTGDVLVNGVTVGVGGSNVVGNTALGAGSLNSNTTGTGNTGVGSDALSSNNIGTNHTAIGYQALKLNTWGNNNTAVGYQALTSNVSGNYNTATGYQSLKTNTGGYNTANGYQALFSNTWGNYNTAVGYQALYNTTSGWYNSAIGYNALRANTTGRGNVAVGLSTLQGNIGGQYNSAVGNGSAMSNTEGDNNTAMGLNSLQNNTTGSNNTAIGYSSYNTGTFSNSTALGNSTVITASNQVRLGNSAVTSIGGYTAWTNVSDGRFKNNVNENVIGLEFIKKLRPVTYNLDMDAIAKALGTPDSLRMIEAEANKSNITQTGFIAQEVEAAAKSLGYDFSGVDAPKNDNDHYGLRYAEFVVPLVKGMQEQQEIIKDQQETINQLMIRLERLEKALNSK